MSDLVWLLRWLTRHDGGIGVWKGDDDLWYAENDDGDLVWLQAAGSSPLRALRNLSRTIQDAQEEQ